MFFKTLAQIQLMDCGTFRAGSGNDLIATGRFSFFNRFLKQFSAITLASKLFFYEKVFDQSIRLGMKIILDEVNPDSSDDFR